MGRPYEIVRGGLQGVGARYEFGGGEGLVGGQSFWFPNLDEFG